MTTKHRSTRSRYVKDDSVTFIRRAAKAMYAEDSDFMEGGCAGVATVFARLVPGAKKVVGTADGLPHAWLIVDGVLIDPITLAGGPRYKTYISDRKVSSLLDHDTYGWTPTRVRRLLK